MDEGAWAGGKYLPAVYVSRAGKYHSRGMRCQLKSNTDTGTLGRNQTTYRYCTLAVFNLEFLEICEFVWSNRISLIVFSHVAFDSWCHIAKQMRNAGAWWEQASVSWTRKF